MDGRSKSFSQMAIPGISLISLGHPTEHTSRPQEQMEKCTSGKPKIRPSSLRTPLLRLPLKDRYTAFNVIALAWHPTSNTLSFTTSQGQLYRWKECIPQTHPSSHGTLKKAPTKNHIHTNSSETSLSRSPSILSRTHNDYFEDEEDDDFVVDDDGAGYVPAHNRKRNAEWDDDLFSRNKRGRNEYSSGFRVKPHEPFQSGSTPWRGNRRYLSTSPTTTMCR